MPCTPARWWRRDFAICAALALLTLAVFTPTLRSGFLNFDDDIFISENPNLTAGLTAKSVAWSFTANLTHNDPRAEYWEPLTLLSRLLDVQLFGFSAAAHHATNLLLHIAAGLILFGALKSLLRSTAASATIAALFLIHPLHVEPVAWLSARKDVLSGLFSFVTIWAYAGYARCPSWRRWTLVLTAFLCANMSKPMGVSLPLVLLLLDYWPLRRMNFDIRSITRVCVEKIPLVIIAIAVSALAVLDQRNHGAIGDATIYPLAARLGNAVSSLCIYIGQTIVPAGLAIYYPHPGRDLDWALVAASCACVLLITTLSLIWVKTRPWWLVGWAWFVVTLLPVLGLVQIGEQSRADRYTYVALVGIFLIVAQEAHAWLAEVRRPASVRRCVAAGVAVIVGAASALSWDLAHYWRGSISVFTRALAVTENNYVAHANLGQALFAAGFKAEGLAHYREAVRIHAPVLAHFHQAAIEAEAHGDYPSAIDYYERILTLVPTDRDSRARLALARSYIWKRSPR